MFVNMFKGIFLVMYYTQFGNRIETRIFVNCYKFKLYTQYSSRKKRYSAKTTANQNRFFMKFHQKIISNKSLFCNYKKIL